MEKPRATKAAKVPIRDTGTAIMGMRVARRLPRKTKTTMSTRSMASTSVVSTSDTDAVTKSVVSSLNPYSIPGGKFCDSSFILARTALATSSAFDPGSW